MNTTNFQPTEETDHQGLIPTLETNSNSTLAVPEQQTLSSIEVDELLAELDVQAKDRRRRRRNYIIFISCISVFVVTLSIVGVVTNHQESFKALRLLSFICVFAGMASANQIHKENLKKLTRNPDIRGAGHYIDALELGNREIKAEASKSLQVVLPLLKASDSYLLTNEHRNILYKQLRGRDTKLILAALASLEQIGDLKAVPVVEWLAANPGLGGRSVEIAATAEAILPALRLRAEQDKAAHSLLRPTTHEEMDNALLLRPAGNADTSTQLLRPSDVDEDSTHANTVANPTLNN